MLLIGYISATSATTGMVFIGFLSHMSLLGNCQPLIFLCFSDNLLSQIVVNQLVRTETKYSGSVGYKQSLCTFILSLIIRKSKKTMQTSVG